jgi:hypothetical protein
MDNLDNWHQGNSLRRRKNQIFKPKLKEGEPQRAAVLSLECRFNIIKITIIGLMIV